MRLKKIKKVLKHFYEDIEGYFDFHEIYREIVKISDISSHFVEVGAWYGKSTAFLAVEIINSKKHIQFDVVDTWEGAGGLLADENLIKYSDIFDIFKKNLSSVIAFINPVKSASIDASKKYEDNSLDFVFIDANHDYEYIKEDIEVWYPKVKIGGYIGGHDYSNTYTGVVKAVDNFFSNKKDLSIIRTSWLYYKRKNRFSYSVGKKIKRNIQIKNYFFNLKMRISAIVPKVLKNLLKKLRKS